MGTCQIHVPLNLKALSQTRGNGHTNCWLGPPLPGPGVAASSSASKAGFRETRSFLPGAWKRKLKARPRFKGTPSSGTNVFTRTICA